MHTASFALTGVFVQFNLSPKGVPEGFILRPSSGDPVQINFEPDLAGAVTVAVREGHDMSLEAVPFADRHSDAGPVFELVSLRSSDGRSVVANGPGKDVENVRGKVIRLNHARRGEINGAILDTGDFVHLRPHGVRAVGGLKIGQLLEATGEVRPGWSNCRVIEAVTANGIEIGKPPRPDHPKKAPGPKGPKHAPHHKHSHPPHAADEFRDPKQPVVSK